MPTVDFLTYLHPTTPFHVCEEHAQRVIVSALEPHVFMSVWDGSTSTI